MLIDESPDSFVIGVEDVGSLAVQHDSGVFVAFCVAVASDMLAFVPNFNKAVEPFDKLAGYSCS